MLDVSSHPIRARTDPRDWLIEADEPLAGLQLRNGGELPGIIVAPALLELVRKSRLYRLRLARAIRVRDHGALITAWAEVTPTAGGCTLGLSNWHSSPLPENNDTLAAERRVAIVRQLAEFSARLGPHQEVLSVDAIAADLGPLVQRMLDGLGQPWTEFLALDVRVEGQPPRRLHDGVFVDVEGSGRQWTAHLVPVGAQEPGSRGFELYLVADPPAEPLGATECAPGPSPGSTINFEIAPVLRQPVARIIANAETIRTQLAGPLSDEYSNYAADIATAGEHLLALIDDLSDLAIIEDEQFSAARDRIDLADVARRAAGILGARARERGIAIDAPKSGEHVAAVGEFRRALQILLNLLGNAVRYSPEGSQVWLRVERDDGIVRAIVADQGHGLSGEQQERVFDKFERLGRNDDGGSGLGLYISRRLARTMGGDLTVESAPGRGARFTLELPGGDPA